MDLCFGRAAAPPPPEAVAHLDECERCSEIYRWMHEDRTGDSVPADLEERLRGRLCASLRPVRPLPPGWILAVCFAGVFGFLTALFLAYSGWAGVGNMSLTQALVVGAVLSFSAIFLSISLSWQMIPGTFQKVPAPALIGVFGAGFFAVVGTLFTWESPVELLGAGWGCTLHGLYVAIPVAGLLLLLASRGAPLSYSMLGSSLGATSGVLAVTVLQFSCPNQHAGHLLLWHGGVVLICVMAGYIFGRIAESVSARRTGQYD
jgi:hypothetical protein